MSISLRASDATVTVLASKLFDKWRGHQAVGAVRVSLGAHGPEGMWLMGVWGSGVALNVLGALRMRGAGDGGTRPGRLTGDPRPGFAPLFLLAVDPETALMEIPFAAYGEPCRLLRSAAPDEPAPVGPWVTGV